MDESIEYEVEIENGLVPAGVLGNFDSFSANGFFGEVTDADTARQQVSNMERLKKLMDAAEQYGQYASQYCERECMLYMRIAEIDGAEDKLTKAKRSMVEWLRGKSQEELDEILEQCSQGVRIHLLYNREMRKQAERYDVFADCQRISEQIVREGTTKGRTTLTRATFYQMAKHPEKLDEHAVSAYVESTRDKLLKRKVLGLGDGNGTYVSPEKCDRQEVASIVKTRLESIVGDLKTIKQICSETGFIVPRSGVEIICELIRSLNDEVDVIDVRI